MNHENLVQSIAAKLNLLSAKKLQSVSDFVDFLLDKSFVDNPKVVDDAVDEINDDINNIFGIR